MKKVDPLVTRIDEQYENDMNPKNLSWPVRIDKQLKEDLRRDIFALQPEEIGKLLSRKYRRLKPDNKSVFRWILHVLFNRDVFDSNRLVDKKLTLHQYVDLMSEIAFHINDSERYTWFVRAVVFYPSYLIEGSLDNINVIIAKTQYKGILFNPLVTNEETSYVLSIVGDSLPRNCLTYFAIPTKDIEKLKMVSGKDVSGKCIAYLLDLIDFKLQKIGSNTYIEQIRYLTFLIDEIHDYRKSNRKYEFHSIPVTSYENLYKNIIEEYVAFGKVDYQMDNDIINLLKSLFSMDIKYKRASVNSLKSLVITGLRTMMYFSPEGTLDRHAALEFLGDCIDYLDLSAIHIKDIFKKIPDNDWTSDFNINSLFD